MYSSLVYCSLIFLLLVAGCNSSDSSDSPIPVYSIGGIVNGLVGDGLALQNNGGDDLAVAGGSFEFPTALSDGSDYEVTVLAQPTSQHCDVSNGSGTISGADVMNVTLTCRGWGTPELIETDDAGGGSPQIAFDAAGNALSVWSQTDDTFSSIHSIWSSRYE